MHLSPEIASEFVRQPFIALTPLYHFTSDANELSLGNKFRLVRYSGEPPLNLVADDILLKHLQICAPDYMLWQLPRLPYQDWGQLKLSAPTAEEFAAAMQPLFFFPAANLFRQFRLFKPGRLFAGETFILLNPTFMAKDFWETQIGQRASLMRIDFSILPHETETFSLSAAEAPFFDAFSGALSPLLDSLNTPDCAFPQLEMALDLFGRADGLDNEVLYSLTALEGLLTSESTSELSYRLSLRVASLLGTNDESRKQVFKDMKEFYDLRSKIVHGIGFKLKPKHHARLQQIPVLREYLRRVLLSIMALLIEGMSGAKLEELLDDIVLDETARRKVQGNAAKYTHLAFAPPEQVF
jgi:hypothetical protein